MRRSVRNLLGLAATAAAIAVGIPAFSTAASAEPVSPISFHDSDYSSYWGSYWSQNFKAKSRGHIDVNYDDEESNSVHVYGKLWDLDNRTYHQGGKCAYVKFRFTFWGEDESDWSHSYKSYKYCGFPNAKPFDFWRHDVSQVQVKVCQIGLYSHHPVKCGYWHDLYDAYNDDYGYDFSV